MEIGQRVVRGESWKWDDQDGGEGGVGTIVVIGRPESLSSPDKTVLVQWDLGARTNYRCGYDDAYDLYLLDNGPIGVIHNNASCSGCSEQKIKGLLWKCARCSGCHLCSTCYHNDVHALDHQFFRIETPNSVSVLLSKRQGKQRIQSKGTFTGAVVTRGPDWDWGNQDGGPHQKGLVTDVKGWDNETFRSVVSVTWTDSDGNVYRRGHKGKVDIKSITPSEGGFYYKDHLPKVCSSMPFASSPTQSTPQLAPTQLQQEFACGDEVRIILDVDVLKSLQRDYGWTEKFVPVIGMVGTVGPKPVGKIKNGIVVKFPLSHSATKLVVNPLALSKVEALQVKDKVYILNNLKLVKKLQTGHGEWTDNMEHVLGKEGLVQKLYSDGDVKVLVGNTSWTLNPAILTRKTSISPVQQQLVQDPEVASLSSCVGEITLSGSDMTTELISAAAQGQSGRVRDILAAQPSLVNSSHQGKTALHISSLQGHVDIVSLLLNSGANDNIQDDDGDTALHHAAFGNKPLVASALIEHGANLNMVDKDNYTPLFLSVKKGHFDVVVVLVNAVCNVNMQDSTGNTVLHEAINNDRLDIAIHLINSANCDLSIVNHQGFNVFHRAALKGRQQTVTAMLNKRPDLLNSAKDDGFTALHLSSLNGHLELVTDLLSKAGCEINIVNNKQQTALLLAVDKTHKHVVRVLLENAADPNIQDDVGDTPLHTAAANHYFHSNTRNSAEADVIRLLIQHGADTTLCNHDNRTAIDLCHGNEMASWIRSASSAAQPASLPSPTLPSPPHESKTSFVPMTTTECCRMCGIPVDCEFQPCGHRVVCHGCSNMFKACVQCKATIASVKKRDTPVGQECKVCSEAAANVIFEPCSHQVVCSECCVRMKKCFVCQKPINRKTTTDGTIINEEQEKYGQNMDSLVHLQAKVQEMEDAQTCPICMENKRNIVFLCGHSTCNVCCQSLRYCHMCRKPIEKKIPLYG